MESLQEAVKEYKQQMAKGVVRKAYQGIMEYVLRLRAYFQKEYPEYPAGNLYAGYMDMTYFPLFPKKLKDRKLKIAIVFLHDTCRFEAWLSGNNRKVQKEYAEWISGQQWDTYRMDPKNPDSIIELTLDDNPDFSDTDMLTKNIAASTVSFIRDIEAFLSAHGK
jgi:hypothetical protein